MRPPPTQTDKTYTCFAPAHDPSLPSYTIASCPLAADNLNLVDFLRRTPLPLPWQRKGAGGGEEKRREE